jgi:hypothetical protein
MIGHAPESEANHFVHNHTCHVTSRIVKMHMQLVTSVITSRTGMYLMELSNNLCYEVRCIECGTCTLE